MVLSNSERQVKWRSNHSELDKQRKRAWIHKARTEGRIPYNDFFLFKGRPQLAQKLAKSLYFAEGQVELRSNLEQRGIRLYVSNGVRPSLEVEHTCTEQCYFFGHTESWIDIEPVS